MTSLDKILQLPFLPLPAILTIGVIILLTACNDDTCSLAPVDDEQAKLSITGQVINVCTNEPQPDVRLSMLDQLGGSFIISWDTLTYSNSEGCFRFEMERDQDFIDELIQMSPSLSRDLINQSLRPWDDNYYYHFAVQGRDTVLSFRRYTYRSDERVNLYVSPSTIANFQFDKDPSASYSFHWSFVDDNLSAFNQIGGFSLDSQESWKVPAEKDIQISITRNRTEVVNDTIVRGTQGVPLIISF